MSNKYYNAKITNPIHRSTAYDFNVQLDFNQLRSQKNGKSTHSKFAPSASSESLDVKEHELVFQMANSRNAFSNRRLHVQSSLNNLALTSDDVRKICNYANVTPEGLALALRDFANVHNKSLEAALEDVVLSKLRYVGVAITPQQNTRAHEKQSSQGFAATRGGLNTIINTGEGAIYPGDTVEIGINFDRLRYGSAPRFHQPSMHDSGVPYDKAVLAVRSAKDHAQFTDATLQTRVLKNMMEKRVRALEGHEVPGNSTVALLNTASHYHPNDPNDVMTPAEVTTVVPVGNMGEQAEVDTRVLTRRSQDRLNSFLLPAELLCPASDREPRSGHALQETFAYEYLHAGGDHQKWSLANVNISGSNVVNAPYNRESVLRYLNVEYPNHTEDQVAQRANHLEVANVGQNMDERIVLKVRGRNGQEMQANIRRMLDALNHEWDRLAPDEGEVDRRGNHVLYTRFLQYWNSENAGDFSVAGYQNQRDIHKRNVAGRVDGAGDPISTGYYYGGPMDREYAPVGIGGVDDIHGGEHVQNAWRGNKRAYYEEFINKSRVPTVFVVWEDHVEIPMDVNEHGQGAATMVRTFVPGIWRLVQVEPHGRSNFRLEPVQSDQLFGYTPIMARSFIYGNENPGVVGITDAGGRDGGRGGETGIVDAWQPYGPEAEEPDADHARIIGSIRDLYEYGNGNVGLANSVFQTPPVFNLGGDVLTFMRFALVRADNYARSPGYAGNDGLTFLLAAMSASGSDNALAHSPIAHLVRETIQCTLECMRGEVVKHNQRVIGVALSGAPPGQPFDLCLSSIT